MDSGKPTPVAQARIISFSSSTFLVRAGGATRTRVDRVQQPRRKTCANRKDYLHCVLSLGRAMTHCTKCGAETLARPATLRTEPPPGHHREQPERPSQRPSPRRLPCVRARPAAMCPPSVDGTDGQASRVRRCARSGRQPCLTDTLPHSELQRPGFRNGSGPFVFSFHFGCAPALRRRKTSRCTRRGMCVAGQPDLVQRDAASDGRARVGVQPKWKSCMSCSSSW